MTRREQLQEQYEEALFALLMDEVAVIEGQKALEENERIKNDSSARVPEEIDTHCRKLIERRFTSKTIKRVGHSTYIAFRRVAVVALVGAMLFSAALAASPALRRNALNLLIEVSDVDTTLSLRGTSESSESMVSSFTVGWIPEGYQLVEENRDRFSTWARYESENGEFIDIYLNYRGVENGVFSIDTENADVEYVDINGSSALFINKNQESHIAWLDEEHTCFVDVLAQGITKEELLKMVLELELK